MTHDELLELIDFLPLDGLHAWFQPALRTVVELHKPYWVDSNTYNVEFCKECIVPIPCKTIQAIEKELA